MQLTQNLAQFIWHRQSQMSSILKQGQCLIAQVEADHCTPQCAAGTYDMHVYDVGHSDQHPGQHLFANAAEANPAVKFLVRYSAHDAADVVEHHKHKKGNQQSVHAAQKVAQPPAQRGNSNLNFAQMISIEKFLIFASKNRRAPCAPS